MPAKVDPMNAIAVLALLEEAPRSGYDLKQAADERLHGVMEITAGTVYYMLKWLETRKWITGNVSRRGKRPERRTYRITPAGRRAFTKMLEEVALEQDRFYSPFDVALYFAPHLPTETMIRAVDRRLENIQRYRQAILRTEEQFPVRWPYHLYYLREKAKEIADCNLRWCLRLKRKILERTSVEV